MSNSNNRDAMLDIDARDLSDTIGAIYDCALDPGQWQHALDRIRATIGGVHAGIRMADPQKLKLLLNVSTGADEHWTRLYNETYFNLIPAQREQVQMEVDMPASGTAFMDRDALTKTRFFQEWASPQGFDDVAGVVFMRRPDRIAYCSVYTPTTRDLISERDLAIIAMLSPHIRRAATISDLLELRTIAAVSFQATIDLLDVGIFLLDDACHLLHVNQAGERLLRDGAPLTSTKSQITLAGAKANDALAKAVAMSARSEATMGRIGIGLPASFADGKKALVHVLPLATGELRPRFSPKAVAAVFVAPSTVGPQIWQDAVAALYDLTPAERRVLAGLVEGLSPAELSEKLQLAMPTVRSHLGKLYSKTGTHRQSEVVALVHELSLPLATPTAGVVATTTC